MSIPGTSSSDPQRLNTLVDVFVRQGHPPQYAHAMAASVIFQEDLDLRNAQLANLLDWLKEEHHNIYPLALAVVEKTRSDFERQVQEG
jgi:hypothetical protein